MMKIMEQKKTKEPVVVKRSVGKNYSIKAVITICEICALIAVILFILFFVQSGRFFGLYLFVRRLLR